VHLDDDPLTRPAERVSLELVPGPRAGHDHEEHREDHQETSPAVPAPTPTFLAAHRGTRRGVRPGTRCAHPALADPAGRPVTVGRLRHAHRRLPSSQACRSTAAAALSIVGRAALALFPAARWPAAADTVVSRSSKGTTRIGGTAAGTPTAP